MGIDIYQISIIFILTYIFLIVPVIIVSYVEIYPICIYENVRYRFSIVFLMWIIVMYFQYLSLGL